VSFSADSRRNFETKIVTCCRKIPLAKAACPRARFQRLRQENSEYFQSAKFSWRRCGSGREFAPKKACRVKGSLWALRPMGKSPGPVCMSLIPDVFTPT